MYQGDYTVYYTPVQAYSLNSERSGIISGGNGEGAITTEGARFSWVYDPDNPDSSGFTGRGWFEDAGPITQAGYNVQTILEQFANGQRTDLNDVFAAWQRYCDENPGTVTWFMEKTVGCWNVG